MCKSKWYLWQPLGLPFFISLQDLEQLIDKICEMAAVMQKSVAIDDEASSKDNERLVQLQQENNGLREILEICTTAKQKIMETMKVEVEEKSSQTEEFDGNVSQDSDSLSLDSVSTVVSQGDNDLDEKET